MDSFTRTVFGILFGWMQTLASMVWNDFYVPGAESLIRSIAENWLLLVAILCLIGTGADIFMRIRRNRKEKDGTPKQKIIQEKAPEEPGIPVAPVREERNVYFASNRQFIKEKDAYEDQADRQENEEDELSRWKEEADETVMLEKGAALQAQVTPAGYTVPMDSPYRRPAATVTQQDDSTDQDKGGRDRIEQIVPRRRRRRLAEIFTDEEQRYDAPLPMIDQNAAYHAPVYPRKWKEAENKEHGQDV